MINKNIDSLSGPDSLRDIEEIEKNEMATGSFHGSDNPNQEDYQLNPYSFTGLLYGHDIIGSHINYGETIIYHGDLAKSNWLTRSVTIPNSVPPLCNELVCVDTVVNSGDPDYYFLNTISEQVLHNYWDKAIDMWGQFMPGSFYDPNQTYGAGQYFIGNAFDTAGNVLRPAGPGPADALYINIGGTQHLVGIWLSNYTFPITYIIGPDINVTDTTFPIYINITTEAGIAYYITNILENTDLQIGQDIAMLKNIKPKIIADTISIWGGIPVDSYLLELCCQRAAIQTCYIHTHIDPDIIFFAGIDEVCDPSYNHFVIPDYVLAEFGFFVAGVPATFLFPPHKLSDNTQSNHFDYKLMLYPLGSYGYNQDLPNPGTHMDITKPETQMWFYWLATRFIDCGHEAIGIGDTFTLIYEDGPVQNNYGNIVNSSGVNHGYKYTWNLVQKIRAYAASINPATGRTHARRGVALCFGTVISAADISTNGPVSFYYDPDPDAPLPNWQRQLILDANRNRIPYSKRVNTIAPCNDSSSRPDLPQMYGSAYTPANYPIQINASPYPDYTQLLYDNIGGLHPQGWICMQAPVYLDYDNGGGSYNNPGCNFTGTSEYDQLANADYGYDEPTWLALQDTNARNLSVIYTYYRLKCINPYVHLLMAGRKQVHVYPGNSIYNNESKVNIYRANAFTSSTQTENNDLTDVYNQEPTIKKIYDGFYNPANTWQHHDFTLENVSNGSTKVYTPIPPATIPVLYYKNTLLSDITPSSSLLIVGEDKIFYIGTDGYIHGYIRVSANDFNGGTWLTVSPTYSAEIFYGRDSTGTIIDATQLVSNQRPAASNLVASPNGTMLLYIDVNGYLQGFNIIDVWHYKCLIEPMTYSGTLITSFAAPGFKTKLLHDAGLNVISNLIFPADDRIYFIAQTADGTNVIYGIVSLFGTWQLVNLAIPAGILPADSLTYNKNAGYLDRIYFSSTDGYLYYFNVYNVLDYAFQVPHHANVILGGGMSEFNVKIVGNLAINGSSILFIGESRTGTPDRYIYLLVQQLDINNYGGVNVPADYLSVPIARANFDTQIAFSPDGSMVAYFGTIDAPSTKKVLAYYSIIDFYEFHFHYFEIDNFTASINDNSLQFTDNNNLFFISRDDNTVHQLKFEPDYCGLAETTINEVWPLKPVIFEDH